jgi:hypothetical protein
MGGTDSALNARVLEFLSRSAHSHGFRRLEMATQLGRLLSSSPHTERRVGRAASDEEVIRRIREIRLRSPQIKQTAALRELRGSGVACEQTRFGQLFRGTYVTDARLTRDGEERAAA